MRSLEVHALIAAADSVSFAGPRGELHLRESHAEQRVYLAEAIDFEFSVVTQL